MRTHRPLVLVAPFLLALVPVACGDSGDPTVGEAAAALTSADTCPGTRWIGKLPQAGSCPAQAPGWVPSKLFGNSLALPASLQSYCLYELNHSGAPTATDLNNLPKLGSPPSTSWLDPDCMVVASLGDSGFAVEAAASSLDQAFFTAAEAPTSMTLPAEVSPVTVAVIDSWPDPGLYGTAAHGFGMGNIIRRLACSATPSSCYVQPQPYLALDLVAPGVRDDVHGGYFGFQGRLARVIVDAVEAFRTSGSNGHLVLNFSLGWDARYNTDAGGVVTDPVNATREALEYAACQGALSIAAAGNAGSGPTAGSGPMYPAGWNQLAAPSCAGPVSRPLVYAVSGVDDRDLPLHNARPGGRAPLVAPGFQAPGIDGSVTVGPYTGSSVSAAVTTAAAATVWHLSGSLRADEVMGMISASAVPTPDMADFCSGTCVNARRVSLCRAVEGVLGTGGVSCVKHGYGAGLNPVWPGNATSLFQSLVVSEGHLPFDGTNLTALTMPAGCSSPLHTLGMVAPYPSVYSPCPSDLLPNEVVAPAVTPQPGSDPCPACMYELESADSVIYLGISENIDSPVYAETLVLSNKVGVVERYDLGRARDSTGNLLANGLQAGNVYKVLMPRPWETYGDPVSGFTTATIEWVTQGGATMSSELIVQ
jgi:hypothetical protein